MNSRRSWPDLCPTSRKGDCSIQTEHPLPIILSGEFTLSVKLFERRWFWPFQQVNGKYNHFAKRKGKPPLENHRSYLSAILSRRPSQLSVILCKFPKHITAIHHKLRPYLAAILRKLPLHIATISNRGLSSGIVTVSRVWVIFIRSAKEADSCRMIHLGLFILLIFYWTLWNSLIDTERARKIRTDPTATQRSLSSSPVIYLCHLWGSFDDALEGSAPPPDISELTHWMMPGSESAIESAHRSQLTPKCQWRISNDVKLARHGVCQTSSLSFFKIPEVSRKTGISKKSQNLEKPPFSKHLCYLGITHSFDITERFRRNRDSWKTLIKFSWQMEHKNGFQRCESGQDEDTEIWCNLLTW
jgi:hypothetical protein